MTIKFLIHYRQQKLILISTNVNEEDKYKEMKLIEILVINENGNIEALRDEAWKFQFIPIISKAN